MTSSRFPKSGYEAVGGLVFFARMLDKIRLHAAGQLPEGYNLGGGLDTRMCRFLKLPYEAVVGNTRNEADDLRVLEACYTAAGSWPTADEIACFNAFMSKRGWRDENSDKLRASKEKRGWASRDEIQTTFDLQDAEEGRK
jgi:gluconokinase